MANTSLYQCDCYEFFKGDRRLISREFLSASSCRKRKIQLKLDGYKYIRCCSHWEKIINSSDGWTHYSVVYFYNCH